MTILYLQARNDYEHEMQCIYEHSGITENELRVVNVPTAQDLPLSLLDGVDGVMVGGAGEFNVSSAQPESHYEELCTLVREVVERNIPFLGICYGGHLLAAALGGKVEYKPSSKETGSYELHRLNTVADDDPLFGGIPQSYWANCGRTDDITELPITAVPLVNSDQVQYHAFKIAGKQVYGVQHHPELNRKTMHERMQQAYDKYGAKYFASDEEFEAEKAKVQDTPVATGMLKQFVELVRAASN